MTETVCGRVWEPNGRPCESPIGENGHTCAACWRFVSPDERAVLLSVESGELPSATETCAVPDCAIPEGHANNVPIVGGFLCPGHWRRVPVVLRHGLLEREPGAVDRAVSLIVESEQRLAGRFPPRPVRVAS